jgi:hypothetical protein
MLVAFCRLFDIAVGPQGRKVHRFTKQRGRARACDHDPLNGHGTVQYHRDYASDIVLLIQSEIVLCDALPF